MGDEDKCDAKRRKGSDKRKDTFSKYGKNTERGMRHKLAAIEARGVGRDVKKK